jgi:nitrate/TMAO reductase-like tetraheme cytochrome c subunit
MTLALAVPDTVVIVKVLGLLLGLAGLLLCVRVLRVRKEDLTSTKVVKLGFVALPAFALYKVMAFLGLFVVPAGAVAVANYHVFEGVKDVDGCLSCHVMRPMGTDLRDPHSDTLAARHFKNRYIPEQQCYHCHADYGLSGTLEAKMEGYRHLARYTSRTYEEPIVGRVVYENKNCLNCHASTPRFETVPSHQTIRDLLDSNDRSCLNCHGRAHPSREDRTPGSARYDFLMGNEK